MNENQKALEVLECAILSEIKAYCFYNFIAEKIEDKDVKFLCRNLSSDENIHRMMLEDRYTHLAEGKECKIDKEFDFNNIESVSSLGRNKLIEMAIDFERLAQKFYLEMSKTISDEKARKILLDLYNTEKEHEIKLMRILEDTK